MKRKSSTLVIGNLIVILLILSGCTGNISNPIDVNIIDQGSRAGFVGLDYIVYVDATVYNRGGEGKATIWAQLTQGNSQWTEKQTIYLEEGETRYLTFEFKDATIWTMDKGLFGVWVEYD